MFKRVRKIIIALLLVFSSVLCFIACGGGGDKDNGGEEPETALSTFSGIVFNDKTVDYNGEEHSITALNVPSFATVSYSNKGPHVNAGEYIITVTVKAQNYNDYTDTAKLTINKIDFSDITFNNGIFEYDGEQHSIDISGILPPTASVVYTSNVSGVTNSATEIGEYEITATITDKNHNTLVIKANMIILATTEERFITCSSSGKIYFQNALDDNELYVYNPSLNNITHVSYDNVKGIIPYANGEIMYISKALFNTSIKSLKQSATSYNAETLFTVGADYIQASGNYIYYAKNGLTNSSSGIYKVDISQEDPVEICLSQGKAKYLQYYNGYLYFADGNNGYKLSKISANTSASSRTIIVDEKIKNLVCDKGVLYFTVNNLLGDYIAKHDISTGSTVKLTIDAGESLTIVGNKLYYINVDLLTSNLIGDGIYSVDITRTTNSVLSGDLVVEAGALGICSLSCDGNNLYYYDVDGYKLIKYNISSKTKTNVLENFVKPEDPTPVSTGSKLAYYEGCVYYLDIWDEKTLHCYNPTTKSNTRLTTNKVTDFSIIGDQLYVNMVSYLVNNDIFTCNLKTGSNLEKISTYSGFEFVSYNNKVYYVEENAAGAKTAIHKCNLDGTEDVIIYEKGVSNLRLVGSKLYFIDGYQIFSLDLSTLNVKEIKVDNDSVHTTVFDTDGTYIYYRDMYSILYAKKRLSRCDMDGSNKVVLVNEDIDPTVITCSNGKVYFYTETISDLNGLYYVSATTNSTVIPTEVLKADKYYLTNFVVIGNDIYFVNYLNQVFGDAHLYVLNVGSKTPTLIK